jgi:hypothetical protein
MEPVRRFRWAQAVVRAFMRGLLFVVPIAATAYALWFVFVKVDAWINVEKLLNRRFRGPGSS